MPAKKVTTQPTTTKKATAQKTEPAKKAAELSASKATEDTAAAKSAASTAQKIVISDSAPATKNKPTKATATGSTTPKKPARKAAAPKSTTSKKTAGATSVTRKAGSGQKTAAVASETRIVAKVDVGFGNSLFIRGEGAELSWEKGIPMENSGSDEWSWSTKATVDHLVFKLLINDEIWCQGDNLTLAPGTTSVSTPVF